MSIEVKGNPNYAAVIIAYDKANETPLEGRDRVVGYREYGYQTIVGKDSFQDGDLAVLFVAGTQLSDQYASVNNLHRHNGLNVDPREKGYLDDNRRIKAIRFAGHQSDALLVPFASLDYALGGLPQAVEDSLIPGTIFDHIGGTEISRKYVLPTKGSAMSTKAASGQRKVRFQQDMFPEHFDTANGFRDNPFQPEDFVFVTQKLHGTSVRLANIPVKRDLTWRERVARFFGIPVADEEYKVVVGSRRVTKSIDGLVEDGKQHFYDAGDVWTEATKHMFARLPKNFVVFAEIVGYIGQTPIQPKYTYQFRPGENGVYIYRVAVVNPDGDLVDLPWRAVQKFAEARGWQTVPELTAFSGYDVVSWVENNVLDKVFFKAWELPQDRPWHMLPLELSDEGTVDEGVVVRADNGFTPTVRKFKSPIFLGHESALADAEVADLEEVEAQ